MSEMFSSKFDIVAVLRRFCTNLAAKPNVGISTIVVLYDCACISVYVCVMSNKAHHSPFDYSEIICVN